MKRNHWLTLSALALCTVPVLAQQVRPDSGTILETQRPQPALPGPTGAPAIVLPPAPPATPFDRSIRVTPTAFRIQGNTLFPEAELQKNVAEFIGKPTDMEGLLKAAAAVRRYYRDRGYLLTEAYLPQQQFAASGGTVTIQVLEARVGRVSVRTEGTGLSESLANRIVRNHLHTGDFISEYALDKPVLLLRDLSGYDATASVEPGANVGEADITVTVKPYGPKVDGLVGIDNYGVHAAGAIRAYAEANLNNPTHNGDQINVRVQGSEEKETNLYRIGYSLPFGGYASRLGLSVTRNEYVLGKQFAPLGASGEAKVYDISVTHPFIRSRALNVLGAITFERKELLDRTLTPPSTEDKRIDGVRLSLLGNFVDHWIGGMGEAFNSYALNYFHGDLKLDPTTLTRDVGVTGFHTNGSFDKFNVEYLRTSYVSPRGRVTLGVQGQLASHNLTSAEKLPLGGPNGIRGYPVGEAVGDSGLIINLEYQHQLPNMGLSVPINGSVFYDWGRVVYNKSGAPAAIIPRPPNSDNLSSLGFGVSVGTFGKYLLSTQLAWRTDNYTPLIAPDKKPRVWFSLQKWL